MARIARDWGRPTSRRSTPERGRPTSRRSTRKAGQRGQATAEYVALLLLVALALASAGLVVADPGIERGVLDGMRRGLCEVSGFGCPPDYARQPCVVGSRGDRDSASLTIAVVRLGANAAVLRELRSDGTVAVTLLGGGAAGAELGLGAGVDIANGRRSLAYGGELRASAIAGLGGGRTWILGSEAAADRLIDALGERRRPLVAGPLGLLRGVLGSGPRVRGPDVTFTEGITSREARGWLGRGRVGGELSVSLDDAAGMRSDRRTGQRTLYLRADRATSAALSARLVGDAIGDDEGSLALGIALDRAGNPVELSATAARGLTGDLQLPVGLRRLAGRGLQASGRLEVDARLDLTEPANAAAVRRLLDALRRPDRVGALAEAAGGLGQRLASWSELQARTYRTSVEDWGVEARVRAGGGVGGGLERRREQSRLTGAWERPGGGVWRERLDCPPQVASAS